MKQYGTKNLTITQRRILERCLQMRMHKREIAKMLGVCLATVYNEIKRGLYEHKTIKSYDCIGEPQYKYETRYSADIAQQRYELNQTTHGTPIKLGNDYDFVRYVERRVIQDKISPCAVCGEIKRLRPCKTVVSKTTMYRYITQGIFMNIRMSDLPVGQRKKHYRKTTTKRPPRGTSIEQRPKAIAERNTFGHWEMDCVVGKQRTKNVLLVLTERLTRKEIIFLMPDRQTATVVGCINKLERRYGKLFRKVFKSITVDNGSEFSDFEGLQKSIYNGKRISVYYCHPYTSCERGTNERINRDIRRLIPKGSDLSKYTSEQIQVVEDWVNNYPRAVLGFATSAEMFAEQLKAI